MPGWQRTPTNQVISNESFSYYTLFHSLLYFCMLSTMLYQYKWFLIFLVKERGWFGICCLTPPRTSPYAHSLTVSATSIICYFCIRTNLKTRCLQNTTHLPSVCVFLLYSSNPRGEYANDKKNILQPKHQLMDM